MRNIKFNWSNNGDEIMKQLSIFLSLVLRHKPEAAHITLDNNGWAKVSELIKGIRSTGRYIDMQMLEQIVREDSKMRYSFNEDFTKIRANQGHSVKVDIGFNAIPPLNSLYHGTSTKNLSSIYENGINSGKRLYVHLSDNKQLAAKVGSRHGKPVVLTIDAHQMHQDGYKFYLSENNVWLTEYVPKEYIKIVDYIS